DWSLSGSCDITACYHKSYNVNEFVETLRHADCDCLLHQFPVEAQVEWGMSQRDANLLWLKDLLRHLDGCQRQLEWAEEPEAVHLVTENMLRDLDSCRRICESLKRRHE